jgi:hypothetical protein
MLFPVELTHDGGLPRHCLPVDTLDRNVPFPDLLALAQITASSATLRRPPQMLGIELDDIFQNVLVVLFKNRKCSFKQLKCSDSLDRSVAVTFQSCNDGALPCDYAATCRYMPRGDKKFILHVRRVSRSYLRPQAPSTREVISANTARMLRTTIPASEGVLFTFSSRLDGVKQHSTMTIGTQVGRRQTEAKFPGLEE